MSTKISGLRRVGIVGLSTLVAASMMTGLATTASALPPPTFTALSAPYVVLGASNQAAGSLTLDFANNFATNDAQTFTLPTNQCANTGQINSDIGFAALPTAALTGPFTTQGGTTAGTATKPTFTTTRTAFGGSALENAACETLGIYNRITLTLTQPSSVVGPTDWFKYTLSNVKYNVGSTADLGPVDVASAGPLAAIPASVPNARVTNGSYTVMPLIAAQECSTGNTLGKVSMIETTAGAFFPAGATTVDLNLSAGEFTAGVTPVITLTAGYTASTVGSPLVAPPATPGGGTYSFQVNAPVSPVKATVTVAGLKLDAPCAGGPPGIAEVVTLSTSVFAGGPMNAANVLDFTARTGGATRYETAADLFNSQLGGGPFTGTTSVVLSGGELYPDALSANYLTARLASYTGSNSETMQHSTGTLLTTPGGLSTAARVALLTPTDSGGPTHTCIGTVYITGGTTAISQAVQDQVEAMHQCNIPAKAFIVTVRLGGPTRYETNQLVNEHNFGGRGPVNTVLLASGAGYADALSLGPVAAGIRMDHTGMPLILTQGGATLGATATQQLSDFNPTNIVIAGGVTVISQSIQDSLVASGYNVLRLGGADRTLTSAAIAGWATAGVDPFTGIKASQGYSTQRAYITTGSNFADAVAAGPVAAANNNIILLSNSPTDLGLGIPSYLGPKAVGFNEGEVSQLWALGLTAATSNSLMKEAAASIGTALTP